MDYLSLKPNILGYIKSNVFLAQRFSEFRIQISFCFRLLSPELLSLRNRE